MYSLSKQSNLAGYRAAFVAGDPGLVAGLREVRKHAGMIVPGRSSGPWWPRSPTTPTSASSASGTPPGAGSSARPSGGSGCGSTTPKPASTSGRRPASRRATTVDRLAERGVLVAPGTFYGAAGREHVRVALTASDERIAAASERLGRADHRHGGVADNENSPRTDVAPGLG